MTNRDKFNIKIYRGETYLTQVELTDSNGSAISLQNATITSQCRSKTTNEVVFSFSCQVLSPASAGIFTIGLSSNSSVNLEPQKSLVYDVKISWTGGTVKHWLGGDVEIIDTVTQ
jgi:hypothetical protein